MLEYVLNATQAELYARHDLLVSDSIQQQLEVLVRRRVNDQEPLQYILGHTPFCDLDLIVRSPILIPRPETEEWVWRVIEQCRFERDRIRTVLDLCTGSGCIALALAYHCPWLMVTAIDNNPQAVVLAQENQQKYSLNNVIIIESDLYQALGNQKFDLIVTNPPYLADYEYHVLDESVRRFEDRHALVAEEDGLACYKNIIDRLSDHLNIQSPGIKQVVFYAELGLQPDLVAEYYRKMVSSDCIIEHDLQGKRRVLVGFI